MSFNVDERSATITGSIDGFPAYEVYANINGSGYQTLYQFEPGSAEDAINLVDELGDEDIPSTTVTDET